jgi:UDP-glucose:(heptosyl)LPS alpha-1,3-glucosyltransferase
MKLALVCRPFSFHGGVETATAGMVNALVRQGGHDVHVLTTAAQFPAPGVVVHRLPVLSQPSMLRQLSFALAARRVARGGGYDVVQSHERGLSQDIYRAGEGSHREYLRAMGRPTLQVNPQHRLLLYLERRIFTLRSARHIVAIASRGKTEIERLYGTPSDGISVVYNGVDLDRFHPDNRKRWRDDTRRGLGLSQESWLIAFIGSGFERKGLAPLLEAVSSLQDRRVHLLVAGKGRTEIYRETASRLGLGASVTFIPPRPDVERLYASADVVALPAKYEPFGNVHLEALASGVPVLTSAAAGGAEAVQDGVSGAVAAAPTAEEIARGLRALRDGDAARLGHAARAAAEPFTYGAQVARLQKIYRRLADWRASVAK